MDTDTLTHPSPDSCITSHPPSATRQVQGCSPNIPVPQTSQRRELMRPVGDPGARKDGSGRARRKQERERGRRGAKEAKRKGKGDRAGGRRAEADKENELGLVLIPCLLFISETNNYY